MITAVCALLMSLVWAMWAAIKHRPTRSELLHRDLYERTAAPTRATDRDINPSERQEA